MFGISSLDMPFFSKGKQTSKYIPAGKNKNVTNSKAGVSDGNTTAQHNAWSMKKFGEIK